MDEHSQDEVKEVDWAKAHFREYLLGRLSLDETERVATAVALIPGLVDEMEDTEEDLIEAYLEQSLPGAERAEFEAQYVHGADPESRAKFRLHEELRSPELKRIMEPAGPIPISAPRPNSAWRLMAVAASVVALFFLLLYVQRSRELSTVVTALKSRPNASEETKSSPQRSRGPVEQTAGSNPSEGLSLPPVSTTTTIPMASPPSRLIWSVPDYRSQYRIRVYTANAQERTSPPLTPKDNAVEYSPGSPQTLMLPWDVFVLGPLGKDEKVLAHYVLTKS